ncbi:MAG: sigma-54 dependent transcriptional regulator [Proteobacteria bacterium]|nr:sigma-54 dependent transcriptional regulator [Pseudomonadota bacterium]MBU4298109.1 sigma-54 dependent transcriptional regulator [Pseudomonadota bacterium]MCG2747393.1 sigma-54 dependent transcriptional regulator [Desulfobulbaceae bacterium]
MKNRGRIFLIDDEELIISMLARSLKKEGYETKIQTNADDVIDKIASWHPDLILLDIHLEEDRTGLDILADIKKEKLDTEVVMLTADDTAESAIRAMKLGAADYLTKPFNIDEVKIVIASILEKTKLREELNYLRKTGTASQAHSMVGKSPVMQAIIGKSQKIAEAKAQTVLITGESGTGKEVLARYIHNWRHLRQGDESEFAPFISVNCTALPENLIESELFGHAKGAFTDAKADQKGMFELANGGTILLDEIGDMRHNLQSKFLRVLEERQVRRLGGRIDLPIDVTVIATTNKELKAAVFNKEFREDLFFRLNTFALHLPPLRERRDDIPLLAEHFLSHFSHKYNKNVRGFSADALTALSGYEWPGNIRELKNVIERCVVLETLEIIKPENLPAELTGGFSRGELQEAKHINLPEEGISLEEVEKDLIRQALERVGGNQTKAAKLLNISYDTLRYQVKKYDLK